MKIPRILIYSMFSIIFLAFLNAPSAGWAQGSASDIYSGPYSFSRAVLPVDFPACLNSPCPQRWDCCVGALFRHQSRADDTSVQGYCSHIESIPPDQYEGLVCFHGLLCDFFKCKNNTYMQEIIGHCPEGQPSQEICNGFDQHEHQVHSYVYPVDDRCPGQGFNLLAGKLWGGPETILTQEGDFLNQGTSMNNAYLQLGCVLRPYFYQAMLLKIRDNLNQQ